MKVLEIILLLFLITVIHESGHLIAMRALGVRLRRIQIFFVNIVEFNFNSFVIGIGFLPIGGYTVPAKRDYELMRVDDKAVLILAGIFFNLIAAGIGAYIFQHTESLFWYDFAWFNLLKGILNLLPFPGTDGYRLLTINKK